jgi:hypothetical protein
MDLSMVVPPGWNVTEPIHVAKRIYDFVQALRGASEDMKSFASKIHTFQLALEGLEECLKNSTPEEFGDLRNLRHTLDGCRTCAEQCQTFIDQFRLTVGGRMAWVWRQDRAVWLKQEVDSQLLGINSLLHIATM